MYLVFSLVIFHCLHLSAVCIYQLLTQRWFCLPKLNWTELQIEKQILWKIKHIFHHSPKRILLLLSQSDTFHKLLPKVRAQNVTGHEKLLLDCLWHQLQKTSATLPIALGNVKHLGCYGLLKSRSVLNLLAQGHFLCFSTATSKSFWPVNYRFPQQDAFYLLACKQVYPPFSFLNIIVTWEALAK